jgi:long-subunit fatty acid transport protein
VLVSIGVAYRVSDRLRVGATLQNQFTKLAWSVVMSGCPPMEACAPEDRTFDMPVDIEQTDYLSPSGTLGVQFDASSIATLGLAIQGPRRVSATGSLAAKLPTNLIFENARVTGDAVSVAYWLPPALRAGVEVRPLPRLRIEAAIDVELWSMHDEITIEPDGITIENAIGGPFTFVPMRVARDFKTSFAPALGVEYHGSRFMIGGGLAYETAAAPASTTSALTVDAAKVLLAIGGGYSEDGWQIGGAIAYATAGEIDVPIGDAKVEQLGALRDDVTAPVNAGSYATSYVVAGLRFARRW